MLAGRLGFAATFSQDVSTPPRPGAWTLSKRASRVLGAPDHTTALEGPDPEFLPGSRCAHRLLAVLLGQGHPRALRALFDLHGPLLCRAVEALGVHRAAGGGCDAGPRRPGRDADTRHP